MQHSPETQPLLLAGIETGLLRCSADSTLGEQISVTTEAFSGSLTKIAVEPQDTRTLSVDPFAVIEIPSTQFEASASVKVTDIVAFEDYETVVFTSFMLFTFCFTFLLHFRYIIL